MTVFVDGRLLRRDAIVDSCYYGLTDCVTRAQELYAAYKANPDVNRYKKFRMLFDRTIVSISNSTPFIASVMLR